MSWYDQRLLPSLINFVCGAKPTRKQREKIVPRAAGDVLEIVPGRVSTEVDVRLPFATQASIERARRPIDFYADAGIESLLPMVFCHSYGRTDMARTSQVAN